ncbi:hypothetical protein MMC07_000156 [Pseudocyphellaria aurata]|nr:hypothetical protein [Pseudocyphellaria aurata]
MFGCTNSNCETVTCLSYQKRTSRRPFRRFTVLSARTLAASLAAQDNPEKGLCPYEPVPLSEEAETRLFRDESNKFQSKSKPGGLNKLTSLTSNPRSVSSIYRSGGQSHKLKNEHQNGDAVATGSQGGSVVRTANEECTTKKALKEKDPKSFTQNLFDTEAMKCLQLAKVREGFLHWAPWLRKEENYISRESQDHVKTVGRNSNAGTRNEDVSISSHLQKTGTITNVQKQMEEPTTVTPPLTQCPESRGGAYISCQVSSRNQTASPNSLKSTSRVSDAMGISPIFNDFILQDRPSNDNDAIEIESNDKNISCAIRAKDNTKPKNAGKSKSLIARISPIGAASIDREILLESPAILPADPDSDPVELPQALRRFTLENVSALVDTVKRLYPGIVKGYGFLQSLGRPATISCLSRFVSSTATQQEMNIVFGTQSIIYVLSTTDALLSSFVGSANIVSSEHKRRAKLAEIVQAFRLLMEIDNHPRNIFPSLWISIGKLHPSISVRSRSALLNASRSTDSDCPLLGSTAENQHVDDDFLCDVDAAHVVKIALAALVASIPECNFDTWVSVQRLRASGRIAPSTNGSHAETKSMDSILKIMDCFDDDLALSVMVRIVRAVAARQCLFEISRFQGPRSKDVKTGESFMDVLLREVVDSDSTSAISMRSVTAVTASTSAGSMATITFTDNEKNMPTSQNLHLSVLVEWLRGVIFSEWDGKAQISRWGPVGGALEFMSYLSRIPPPRGVNPEVFYTPFISDRLDVMEMPAEWLLSKRDRNTVHLMSYSFLFVPSALVSYFRAINHAAMSKTFGSSMAAARLLAQMTFADRMTGRGELRLRDRLKIATSYYLVLEIRRGEVLTDALNQLWRRERRELMRPLKVRMGMEEGEEGLDHGGVQQEFFRVALSEALRSDYGLFVTDEETRMSWFQPCSLEPLYKFELLGLLTSLAVYNGLTLPVTFPLALYRKLLDLPVTNLAHIDDGWPTLTKGLKNLLCWTDGDVEDVFVRSYVFSVEALGKTIAVDIAKVGREDDWHLAEEDRTKREAIGFQPHSGKIAQSSKLPKELSDDGYEWIVSDKVAKSPMAVPSWSYSRPRSSSSASQTAMVTNQNREQYVEDYIFWLTDKSIRPQYEAFARGFYVCLDRKAVSIFNAESLKGVVEGIQEIDVDALQETARYEGGYSAGHRVIKDFWHLVRQFQTTELQQLLEFVTASDRIPVNGVSSIQFVIQRNGVEDERLPTSLTCFGRLLLPEYSSRKKLSEKLYAAIENSKGFGVA